MTQHVLQLAILYCTYLFYPKLLLDDFLRVKLLQFHSILLGYHLHPHMLEINLLIHL
jgi:hypothetical protein